MIHVVMKDKRTYSMDEEIENAVRALRNVRPDGWLCFRYRFPSHHFGDQIALRVEDIDYIEECRD